jgi:hypothetical protein
MTRLPEKRGISQVEEDKSLILRSILNLYANVFGLKEFVNAIEATFTT